MSEPDQINSAIKNRTQNITTEIGNDEGWIDSKRSLRRIKD